MRIRQFGGVDSSDRHFGGGHGYGGGDSGNGGGGEPIGSGPIGPSGGETWAQSVDRRLGEIRDDIKWYLAGIGAVLLLIVGGGATAYVRLSDQNDATAKLQTEAAGSVNTIDARINGKLDTIVARIDAAKPDNGK